MQVSAWYFAIMMEKYCSALKGIFGSAQRPLKKKQQLKCKAWRSPYNGLTPPLIVELDCLEVVNMIRNKETN